ncbi:hypothetical protein AgCh_036797 [Apium graveolens]
MNRLTAYDKAMNTWAKWANSVNPRKNKLIFQAVSPNHARVTLTQYLFLLGLKFTSATFTCAFINMVPVNTFIMAFPFGLEKVNLKHKSGRSKVFGAVVSVGGALLLTLYIGIPLRDLPTSLEDPKIGGTKRWGTGTLLLTGGSGNLLKALETTNQEAGKGYESLSLVKNMKKKTNQYETADLSTRNIVKSQGADGSGITSAKDATSTRLPSGEKPFQGRKLISLAQEAMQGPNYEASRFPAYKRKRVAVHPEILDKKLAY